MASAAFTIQGSASPVSVSGGTTVTLALVSIVGVGVIEWAIIGQSLSTVVTPTITPAGSPLGATATFRIPNHGDGGAPWTAALGVSFLVQCRINSGRDATRAVVPSYTATGLVGVLNSANILPFSFGETFERNATTGIANDLNSAISLII
jgi:hypothetical protein